MIDDNNTYLFQQRPSKIKACQNPKDDSKDGEGKCSKQTTSPVIGLELDLKEEIRMKRFSRIKIAANWVSFIPRINFRAKNKNFPPCLILILPPVEIT
jgi:hypothetical protein